MDKNKTKDLLSLTFKIPSNKDGDIKTKYHPLSPKQYLDFIECGMKLMPDLKVFLEKHKKDKPNIRFKL